MNTRVSLPEPDLDAPAVRRRLEEALTQLDGERLAPAPGAPGAPSISLYLPAQLSNRLEAARPASMPMRVWAEALLAFHARRAARPAPAPATAGDANAAPDPIAAERDRFQDELVARAEAARQAGRIALLEASTGVGKTRAMARLANLWSRPGGKRPRNPAPRVGIYAPSFGVLAHQIREWLDQTGGAAEDGAVWLGRRQIVDEGALRLILALDGPQSGMTEAQRGAVRAWLDAGGPPRTEAATTFRRLLPQARLLMDDLRALAPDIPAAAVGLEDGAEGEGAAVYAAMRARAEGSRVLFTTHAALCLGALFEQRAEGSDPFPRCPLKLVDEGHDLEESMTRVVGSDLSLLRLQGALGPVAGAARAIVAAGKLTEALQGGASDASTLLVRGNAWPVDMAEVPHRAKDLDRALRTLLRALPETHELREKLAAWAAHAKTLAAPPPGLCVWVRFSPMRRLPSLTIGPSSVRRLMEKIWEGTTAGAIFSGTLYIPLADGAFSAGYVRMKLGLSEQRTREHPPLVAPWILRPVTVRVPTPAQAAALSYPGGDEADHANPALLRGWLAAVGARLRTIAAAARGGTLVLCCSHADVRGLAAELAAPPELAARLVVQSAGRTVTICRDAFLALHRQGARPVWLATGAAWTGLDLADPDHGPADDTLLTDEVITRVPWSANQSAVQLARRKSLGFGVERLEMLIRLRQGFGRLVRRPGVGARTLWFLDGRIHGTKGRQLYQGVETLLRSYARAPLDA